MGSGVAYAPATGVVVPEATTVVLAPPVQADYVVMNGKTYASMEEAMQDYCAGAAAPVSNDAALVEPAQSEEVQQPEEVAEPTVEKTVRAVKPTKKGCC